MRVNLPVPFVTQQGAPLEYNPNDCSQASVAQIINAYTGSNLSALDVALATGTNDNKPQSMASVVRQGAVYGIELNIRTSPNAIPAWYRAMLNDGKPVIALCDYFYLPKPGDFPHFLVVKGYDTDQGTFILNDPYQVNGADWEVTEAQFNAAISSARYNYSYQAIYPTEALVAKPKGLGHNVQALYIPDLQQYINTLRDNPPPAMVVIDELPRAVEIKKQLPQTNVIYRAYSASGGDDNSWNGFSPARWAEVYAEAASHGLTLYADNEPAFNEQSINWLLGVANICVQRGWKCVLGNWSVGMPHESEWHKAEHLLRYVSQYSNLLSIGLHEYCPHLTSYEFGRQSDPLHWGAIDTNAKPYLMGRFRWMLDYCKSKGFKAPNIHITEWGWDSIKVAEAWQTGLPGYQHGAGYPVCEAAWNQWKPANWTTGKYAARQLGWIYKELYQKHPEIKGVCAFTSYGVGAWDTNFAFGRKQDFIEALKAEDFSVNETETVLTFNPTLDELIGTAWFRATPNGTGLGLLVRGDVFIPTTEVQKAGNYYWRKGTSDKYGVGWAAVRTLDGKPVGWKMKVTL